jgi:threonine aldolase
MIELRSDTFTVPTERMRERMSRAVVGDDVYGEDPTVNLLEETAAAMLGKEAACFMPSGTMANLTAMLAHASRGAKIVVAADSDIFRFEAGGASVCGGITYGPVPSEPDGSLSWPALKAEFDVDPADAQLAPPALICLENTHCARGGVALPLSYLSAVRAYADRERVPVHMDGARIFNAAAALRVPAAQLAAAADSVQFCLSKGLCAPVGSVLTGSRNFVARARRYRKMLGGGMRQAGVIAAAGLVALEEMVGRLAEDHVTARLLAAGLAAVPGITVDQKDVQTNIVMFRLIDPGLPPARFVAELRARGVALMELTPGRLRAVTHHDVTSAHIDIALSVIGEFMTDLSRRTHSPW